jgi:hypothetical protein
MNVKDLQALVVLRNHAQALLNGIRADLKMSKEEKASLMNGLKKADEVFLKKFESSVEASALTTVARTWTSTDSEESVLSRAMSLAVASATSSVTSDTTDKATSALAEVVAPTATKVGLFSRAATTAKEDSLVSAALKGLGVESSTAASQVVTVPVATSNTDTASVTNKKARKGTRKA